MNKKSNIITTALCHQFPAESSDVLWVPLAPVGKFSGRDGRKWTLSDADAVIKNTQLPFILDIDHASEKTANTIASGWFTELKVEDNHILGKLELNSTGSEVIADKRYKYYSPAFIMDKNGFVHKFISVGLTNKPNLNVPSLNAEQDTINQKTNGEPMENTMTPELLAALNLSTDADETAALNAIERLKHDNADSSRSIDTNAFVPKATHEQTAIALNTANQQLQSIAKAAHDDAVSVAINAAVVAKKIAPADKEFYIETCATEAGLEKFRQFTSNKAPLIGDIDLPESPEGSAPALNAAEKDIIAQLGIEEADYLEIKKQEAQ